MRLVQGQNEPEPWIDRREMARQLGIGVSTLDRWVAEDRVPSCLFGARTRRFKGSVVIAHLARAGMSQLNSEAA